MMLNVSFDIDISTRKIKNVTIIEKQETETPTIIPNDYDMELLDNKIQLSSEAVTKLKVNVGDRIAINYWYAGPNDAYPIISKADIFDNGVDGNILKKSNTLSFRGEQNETLLKYGKFFLFEEWKDKTGKIKEGVFKLIPVTKEDDSNLEHKIVDIEKEAIEAMDQKEIEDDADWLFEV